MLGIGVRDATAGFRAYRAEALQAIGYAQVRSQGYCFQIDLVLRFIRAGLTVTEVPITFVERTRGREQDEPGDRGRGAVAGGPVGRQGRVAGLRKHR